MSKRFKNGAVVPTRPLMLTEKEVLTIHDALVKDFIASDDPISPAGIRDAGLLSSAVSRQWTSFGETFKYPAPIANAVTLMYGICNDHAFWNGNKRTALVAMLAHLDRNGFMLIDTSKHELFEFMLSIADHRIGQRVDPRSRREPVRPTADEEIEAAFEWVDNRIATIDRNERIITYRELRRILAKFRITLEDPKGNRIIVYRTKNVEAGFLVKKIVEKKERLGTITWPGETKQMSIAELRHVRRTCGLTEHDGCDSNAFYDYQAIIDEFINRYRRILERLAKY